MGSNFINALRTISVFILTTKSLLIILGIYESAHIQNPGQPGLQKAINKEQEYQEELNNLTKHV